MKPQQTPNPECEIIGASSRMCEYGQKSCETRHKLPSILPSEEEQRRLEHNRDLEYESRLSDEQENGPTGNRPDEVGWRHA